MFRYRDYLLKMHCRRNTPNPTTMRQLLNLLSFKSALGRIRFLSQLSEDRKELLRLADEQPVGRQGLGRAHCSPFCLGGANDRTGRELAAEEDGGLGHDQVGLEGLCVKRRGIEVWKHQSIRGVGQGRRIACPGRKISDRNDPIMLQIWLRDWR